MEVAVEVGVSIDFRRRKESKAEFGPPAKLKANRVGIR